MQELIKQLTSLSWWISVVIVGVLASLAAAYLKPRTDRIIGSVSGRYRRRNDRLAKARAEQIEALRSDRHEQIMFASSISYTLLRSICFMLIGVVIMIVTVDILQRYVISNFNMPIIKIIIIVTMCYSCLVIMMAFTDVLKTISNHEILEEARKSPTNESKATLDPSSNESTMGMNRDIKHGKE